MFVNKKNYSFLIGSAKILILLLLISATLSPILCQNKKYAIVSNIGSDGKSDRNQIEYLTDLIKKEPEISVALLIGNIGSNNFLENLRLINSFISENNLKIKFIPGVADYSGSTLNGYLIDQEIPEQNFLIDDTQNYLFGFNSAIPFIKGSGFVDIETINLLKTEIRKQKEKTFLFFSNTPANEIINYSSLTEEVKDNRVINFYPEKNNYTIKSHDYTEIGLAGVDKSENPIYHIIEIKYDSLIIIKKYFDNYVSEVLYSEALNKLSFIKNNEEGVSKEENNFSIVKKIDYNSTSKTNLIVSENRAYITLDNGLLYLLDFKGNEKFVAEIFGDIGNNAILYKDLFLVATIGGDLYSINSNNGEVIQVVGIGENITTGLSLVDLDKTTKSVVLGTAKGNIFAYDAFTFEILWNKKISDKPIISRAAIGNDKLFFIDEAYTLYCVNAKSGVLNWKFSQGSTANRAINFPMANESNVFTLSPEGNVIAIDILQGKKIWSADIKTDIKKLYLNKDSSNIFALNSSGRLFAVSVKDGRINFTVDLNKFNIFGFEILEIDNDILIGLSDGSLSRIRDNKMIEQIIKPNFIPITGLSPLSNISILLKDMNGTVSFIKITE